MERPTHLRISETIVPARPLEPGIPTPAKERLECLIYPVQYILQGLAKYQSKVWSDLLALYKSGGLFNKCDALTCHAIRIPTVLERSVVQLPAQVKSVLQELFLPTGRKQSILVGLACQHLNALLSVNVLLNGLSRDIACRTRKETSCPQTGQSQQMGIFSSQVMRRSALYPTNHIRCAVSGAYSNEQVDVVRHNSKLQNLPALRSTDFLDKCLAVLTNVLDKHLLATFRTPYQVVHNQVYPMLVTLIFHAPIIAYGCRFVNRIYKTGMVLGAETHSSTAHKWAWLSATFL